MGQTKWQPAPQSPNEAKRIEVLQSYCVLDTPKEPVFEDLAALGSVIFQAPIVLVSLVDEHRQFFKSVIGLSVTELPRDSSFCGYTILLQDVLIVLDTANDDRFRFNPLVVGSPDIRFYAGAPLIGKHGMPLGSYCVIDTKPREAFTDTEQECLKRLASLTVDALEKRLYASKLSGAERAMQEANERYLLATRATTEGIWDWNCATDMMFQSARLRSLIGAAPVDTQIPLGDWYKRIHPSDLDAANANVRRLRDNATTSFDIEYRIRHEDSTWRWMHNRGVAVHDSDGALVRVVGALADITTRKLIDPLTGLQTRTSLMNQLEARLAKSDTRHFSLLLVDLDGFKRVNVSLGRSGGDLLLTECTERLNKLLSAQPSSLIAHIAADEFGILLGDISDEVTAVRCANDIRDVLQEPFTIRGKSVSLAVSIGVAICTESCERAGTLMHWAEVARHESKVMGGGQTVVFTGKLHQQVLRRVTLASDLRRALTEDALTLHYQPKMDLVTNEVIGFEALSRWQHPTLGPISPAEFVPIAEDSDLILELGRWTLRTALRQLAAWRSRKLIGPDVTMAVNLSARQFSDPDLISNIVRKLKLYDLPATHLSIEVTEGILIIDQDEALTILRQLKSLGVGLDLDDFGTGYSSMSYLHQFPFDSLKIDRSFVMHMSEGVGSKAIVQSIVALGNALGLKVIAEGIEQQQQKRTLIEMGCHCGQGYLLSKPLPADDVDHFMKQEAVEGDWNHWTCAPKISQVTPTITRELSAG